MNKTELCAAIAAKGGFAKKDAEKYTAAFVEVVSEALKQGDKVQIVGFGTFEVKDRPARKARNPRTARKSKSPPPRPPRLRPARRLRTA